MKSFCSDCPSSTHVLQIPQETLLRLLDGAGCEGVGMDCSIVPCKRYPEMSVISTTDFFFPLVEDPYEQGRIACCNVLSDMYALGVVDVDNVLMLIAASLDMPQKMREICTRHMMRGFCDQAKAAGTAVTGGQSVQCVVARAVLQTQHHDVT